MPAGFKLVAIALGPDDRMLGVVCVRMVSAGHPVGVLAPDPVRQGTVLDGPDFFGSTALAV